MIKADLNYRRGDFSLSLSLTAPASQVMALFGPSGAGKTTLAHLVAGLLTPNSGRITLGERVLYDSEQGINLPPERRRVGMVFQDGVLFPHMTVANNLLYGPRRMGERDRPADFSDVVSLLDLGGLLNRRPPTLSGGERRRAALGRAILAKPEALLLDEPLAGLDTARKEAILPYLDRLRGELGLPILYVTHAVEEVLWLADGMAVIADGGLKAHGPVEDILSRSDLTPLTGVAEGGCVLATRVAGHETGRGVTRLSIEGDQTGNVILVPLIEAAVGTRLRARIRARDVMLATTRPRRISAQNVLRGVIQAIDEKPAGGEPGICEVLVDIGAPLRARLLKDSASSLGLVRGKTVYAIFKTVSLNRANLGFGTQIS